MINIDATHTVLKHDISHFLPMRVILRTHEGKIQGYVEQSFSMDWSDRYVQIYWTGKAYSIIGEHNLNGLKWAAENSKVNPENIHDPLDENCPIEIDWEKWLNATDKFGKRNAPFKVNNVKSEKNKDR